MKKEILVSETEIEGKVQEIADILNKEFKNKEPLIIGLLTGAFIFCADLLRKLNFDYDFEFIKAKSYLNSTESSGNVHIEPLKFSVQDRDIILVDDILDTGHTMHALIDKLMSEGAKSVTSVVLFNKDARRKKDIKADIIGFDIDNYYLIGYGMDDDEGKQRGTTAVYYVTE